MGYDKFNEGEYDSRVFDSFGFDADNNDPTRTLGIRLTVGGDPAVVPLPAAAPLFMARLVGFNLARCA